MLIPNQQSHRLRVLFVLPPMLPTPPQGYGGVEAVAAAVLPELSRTGTRVTVTTPHGSDIKVSELRTITEPLYPILSFAYNLVSPKVELYVTKVMHLAWKQRFDIIHDFSGMVNIANSLAAPLPSHKFPPLVHTIHGPIRPFIENYIELSRYTGITFTAISNAQLSEAPLRVRQRTEVIYNCLNVADYPEGKGGGRYLSLGRFTSDKGQDRLIEFCANNGIELDIAGPVAEMTSLTQIEEEAAKGTASSYAINPDFQLYLKVRPLIDGHQIRFHGNVSGKLKHHLLQNARALVIPNRWAEPFGMVAIEAMASGTPVVAMNTGAMPELIKPGETGLLASSFEELGEFLRTDAISKFGRAACRPHVERQFSPATVAKQYLALYRRLLQPHPISSALGIGIHTPARAAVLYERLPNSRPTKMKNL